MVRTVPLLLVLLLDGFVAGAHELSVYARVEGERVVGSIMGHGNAPMAGVSVYVLGSDGEPVGEVETDSEGRFEYAYGARMNYTFVADLPDGHRAEFTVPLGELEEESDFEGSGDLEEVVEKIVGKHTGRIRDQLHGMERQRRLQDIVGGLGYIMGVVGILALWKSRSSKRNSQ